MAFVPVHGRAPHFDEEDDLGGLGDAAAHHGGDANDNDAATTEARLAADPRVDAAEQGALDFPARQEAMAAMRRWSAALLRGARFVLSPVADGVFHLGVYILDTPISRFVGYLIPEVAELADGMLAFAALVAMAARPRTADHGAVHWRTALVRRARVVLSVAADRLFDVVLYVVNSPVPRFFADLVPGVTEFGYAIMAFAMAARPRAADHGGHADHDEEVGAEEDGYGDHDDDDAAGAALGGGGGAAGGGEADGEQDYNPVAVGGNNDGGGEDADAGDQDLAAEDDPAVGHAHALLPQRQQRRGWAAWVLQCARVGVFVLAAGAFYGVGLVAGTPAFRVLSAFVPEAMEAALVLAAAAALTAVVALFASFDWVLLCVL